MFLKITFLGLIFLIDSTLGSYGICQPNCAVCRSEKTFSLCVEGTPTNFYFRCPKDLICSDDPAICIRKNNKLGNLYGDDDRVLDEETASATTNPLTTEPQEEDMSPSTQYSVSSSTTYETFSTVTEEGTSLTTEDTTDVESTSATMPPRDATTYCSDNKFVGTVRAEGDTTCKRYYVCTTTEDGFKGYEFHCGDIYYFDSETSLCQKEKPGDC